MVFHVLSLEAFEMYYVIQAFEPSLNRECTDSLIHTSNNLNLSRENQYCLV